MGKYTYRDAERIIDGDHPDFVAKLATIEGDSGRWLTRMVTIVKDHDGQHWAIEWGSPLTEMQDCEFSHAPEMVEPREVTIPAKVVTEWFAGDRRVAP